ncbi:F0F1 ATP synthase subunit epsilon [Candidatus Tisiphia endosymbiont of Beris chalybata]|uniref:F0F1 ATP synthase subunit epsilon n=1 Tax=Candidatus Tisiphia endosymbiont of Beris chalybata TaxID=3066262 RepID=UPI00312CBAFD
MNKILQVKIIIPTSILFDKEALMVTIPGAAGELGILPGHTLLIVNLKEGLVKISIATNSKLTEEPTLEHLDKTNIQLLKFFVCTGIAEITNKSVNIITEFAIDVTSLSLTELPAKIELLKKMLEQGVEPSKISITNL